MVPLFFAPLSASQSFGRRHSETTFSDEFTDSGATIHHVAVLVINGLGDPHDFAPMMLDDKHLTFPNSPTKISVRYLSVFVLTTRMTAFPRKLTCTVLSRFTVTEQLSPVFSKPTMSLCMKSLAGTWTQPWSVPGLSFS